MQSKAPFQKKLWRQPIDGEVNDKSMHYAIAHYPHHCLLGLEEGNKYGESHDKITQPEQQMKKYRMFLTKGEHPVKIQQFAFLRRYLQPNCLISPSTGLYAQYLSNSRAGACWLKLAGPWLN